MRLPGARLMGLRGAVMDLFTKLLGDLLIFVYHCFDRIVIHGYLSGLSRPEQVVYFFRQVLGVSVVSKEDYVQPWLRKMVRRNAYGVYFIFKSMEQGPSYRITMPKFPTADPNYRIL